ncbi:MAG: type II toxin-antitoxin system Phd/YefM family antitoxin [Acidobacteriota bacterium]|nr:type II toxin-antitoxin system Phd/YefM family antitoxin [Acidobacteriota bacterium]
MGEQHSIAEARSSLPKLVREAESGKAVELTRRGEGVAVLIGRREYQRLVSRSRRFSEAWDDFVREIELASLGIDPDEVFADVRDDAPGRDAGV